MQQLVSLFNNKQSTFQNMRGIVKSRTAADCRQRWQNCDENRKSGTIGLFMLMIRRINKGVFQQEVLF